jgi:hypothetical protein
MRTAAGALKFGTLVANALGPPAFTSLQWGVTDADPRELLHVRHVDVRPLTRAAGGEWMLQGQDSGQGGPGRVLGFDVFREVGMWTDVHLAFEVELLPNPGVPIQPAMGPIGAPEGDESWLGIVVPVTYAMDGTPLAHSNHALWWMPPATLRLGAVSVSPADPTRRDVAGDPQVLRVEFDLIAVGAPDLGAAILSVEGFGDCVAADVITAALEVPVVPNAGLRALPSVMRTATRLELARAAERAGSVSIYDVTGRRVRELGLGAGATEVGWDGRGAGGSPVPAGVYLARFDGDGSVARIVRLR